MRTNGFALFTGPSAWERAEKSVSRVVRCCTSVQLGPGPSFGKKANASDSKSCFVAYSLEEEGGFPLVHGFADDPAGFSSGASRGEFAFLTLEEDHAIAGRDPMGTRPLYVDEAQTCVASDHRFFIEKPILLPNGVRIDLTSGEKALSRVQPVRGDLDEDEAARALSRILEQAVSRRVGGRKKVAVSFSGGLDSSIIALIASRKTEVVLCSAFTKASADKERTRKASELLGLEHRGVTIADYDFAREVASMELPFEPTRMDKALWCLYSTTSRLARDEGAELILLGQLADELFGGYMKYALRAKESETSAAKMMEEDVAASGERAFVRDEMACSRFTEVRFPFADQAVAEFAMGLPLSQKIRRGERKAVLRAAAAVLGLPEELARAPKKAAQYSSGLSKLIPP